LRIDIGASTDVGRTRSRNEDCYCVLRELGLFVISDGIGGQANGEVASTMAVEAVVTHCQQATAGPTSPLHSESHLSVRTRHLANAVRWANRKIRTASAQNAAYSGMGATLVAAWLNGECLSLVSIGDSRAYIFRNGTLKQLTRDHSLAAERARRGLITKQEASACEVQNVLLQALGTSDKIDVEAEEVVLQHGDVVLLCTDGLTHMASDEQIASALVLCEDVQRVTDRLVEMASARGGKDNITVVVLRFGTNDKDLLSRLRRRWGSVA
jgi:PPM family protein phosphatase